MIGLLPQHAALIEASTVSREVAEARGYRSVETKAELERLGFSARQRITPTLLIPIWNAAGNNGLYTHRPDNPRVGDGGKLVKYEFPRGSRMQLDVPPCVRPRLGDPGVPLFITEGVRKADAAASIGLACIDVIGTWNWRGTNAHGGKAVLPDWDEIALNGRAVYIVFDSDVMLKRPVYEALGRLRETLRRRDAHVRLIYLPAGPGGTKVGLDDFLAAGNGVNDLLALATTELREPPKTADQPSQSGRNAPARPADFIGIGGQNRYLYRPTGEFWEGSEVRRRLGAIDGLDAATWIDQNQSVESLAWLPGESELIEGRYFVAGDWRAHAGGRTLNLYTPPRWERRRAERRPRARQWLRHLLRVYPDDAEHIVAWLAHRVQRPAEKLNHALVLGGDQGIGKDTLLDPVRLAVGPANFQDVTPAQLMGRFNTFVRSVVLRVSEIRDLGDVNRYSFYEHTKTLIAAPPEMLACEQKYLNPYAVPNLCGVIFTTNHRQGGLYLPADDRRHYVAWSEAARLEFEPEYWDRLYRWYDAGGREEVAEYLSRYDLADAGFNPKAAPPRTEAFLAMVDAGHGAESAEIADALEALGWPAAVTIAHIRQWATANARFELGAWLSDRKNDRQVPHRLAEAGYVPVRNPDEQRGRWFVGGARVAVYARRGLSPRERSAAAAGLR